VRIHRETRGIQSIGKTLCSKYRGSRGKAKRGFKANCPESAGDKECRGKGNTEERGKPGGEAARSAIRERLRKREDVLSQELTWILLRGTTREKGGT